MYGGTIQHAVLISSSMQGYQDLMQRIDFHTKTKNQES
jgi:hypothetical protein